MSRLASTCFRAAGTSVLVAAALVVAPGVARAQAQDAQAKAAIKVAVDKDFLEMRFDDAESKLRAAAKKCGPDQCSSQMKGKVLAALGSVLASGKKQLADAKEAFIEALTVDPGAVPNADIASTEADYAFEQAKKDMKGAKKAPPVAAPPPKKEGKPAGAFCKKDEECEENLACQDGVCTSLEPAAKKKEPPRMDDLATSSEAKERVNWLSISFAPDFSIFQGENVCTAGGQADDGFYCLRGDNTHYVGTPTVNNGDNVTLGMAPGTMRVIIEYERIVAHNVGLAARLGFGFNGATEGGASFVPISGEARVAYYIGKRPFEGKGFRPGVFLSGGGAQFDNFVDVTVLEDGNVCGAPNPGDASSGCTKPSSDDRVEQRIQTLRTFKRAGPGFAGGGLILRLAPADNVEFRILGRMAVTFPVVVTVFTPEAGFAFGF